MHSEEEMFSVSSDCAEEDDDEDDEYSPTLSPGYATAAEKSMVEDDFPYEILTTDELVQHMVNCIKEVNTVVQVRCKGHVLYYFVLVCLLTFFCHPNAVC